MDKSENPVILCVIYHRQNPIESTMCYLILLNQLDVLFNVERMNTNGEMEGTVQETDAAHLKVLSQSLPSRKW
jgi:hypothetical protein